MGGRPVARASTDAPRLFAPAGPAPARLNGGWPGAVDDLTASTPPEERVEAAAVAAARRREDPRDARASRGSKKLALVGFLRLSFIAERLEILGGTRAGGAI